MRKHFSDKDIRKEVLENMIRQLTKTRSWNKKMRKPIRIK